MKLRQIKNVVVFDGDGDGTSAAAIWLLDKPDRYFAITNKFKSNRSLVKEFLEIPKYQNFQSIEKLGIFDIDAEQNLEALKKIPWKIETDFIDHHTKDPSVVPFGIHNFAEPDSRENCTATISYNIAQRRNTLNDSNLIKATQLAIIGLANDGKTSASQNFGGDLVSKEDRESLIKYAKAINFGSATGKLNSKNLLEGFVKYSLPLNYLISAEKPNQLIEERRKTIYTLEENSKITEKEGIVFYELPSKTNEEKEISKIAYNEFLNSQMTKAPEKIHLGLIETPEGSYIFSARDEKGQAYELIEKISEKYGKKAFGRNTSSGFSTENVERKNLLEKILEARK